MRLNGSTLYVFPSASEDIGLNINSQTAGVALSGFALLNFTRNNFSLTDPDRLALSLQNYAMNFETVLLNEADYSHREPYTVTENVFWHWMLSHGGDGEKAFALEKIGDNVYREKCYASGDADRMVQCVGTIDGGNSLSTEFGMFNETYVTVPTSYGNGPVFFRTVGNGENVNFKKGKSYPTGEKTPNIQGRDATDYSYLGSITAEYDDSAAMTYVTAPENDAFEIVTDLTTVQSTLRSLGASGISVKSFDDVNVDFDDVLSAITVGTETPYSMSGGCEFKFNSILLYYSMYDLNDVYKQPMATNLFGIVFLDGGGSPSGDYVLSPVIKKKSYKGQSGKNAYFGNSYSFRVNIKTLSVYDNTDARIEDNTTATSIYSQDFNDVVSNLNRAIDIMNTNVQTTRAIQDSYMSIRADLSDFREQFSEYKKQVTDTVTDTVKGEVAAAKDELKDYVDEKLAEAVAQLETYDGGDVNVDGDVSTYGSTYRPARIYGSNGQTSTYASGKPETAVQQPAPAFDAEALLLSLGIRIVAGIIPYRGRKPSASGWYLRTSKEGNVSALSFFDGEEWGEQEPCERGKIYSVAGVNHSFDGTTCNVI